MWVEADMPSPPVVPLSLNNSGRNRLRIWSMDSPTDEGCKRK
jgi:hypothetical protein